MRMNTYRPRRSALFLPASNPRAIDKARTLSVDAVVLDLEDAVAPDAKAAARAAALAAVRGGFGTSETVVRVNAIDSAWGEDDLAALRDTGATVLVPKVRDATEVGRYRAALGDGVPLWLMIETCAALGRMQDIAAAGAQGLVLGVNDLALELGARPGAAREWLAPVRTRMLVAARSCGLVALDGVCNDFRDDERLRAECESAAAMGFDGKSLIHPGQIAVCNAAFAPTPAELDWAVAVCDAFAGSAGGVIQVDGRMVEALHLEQAKRMLAMAS